MPTDPGRSARERVFSLAMRRKEDFLGARVPKELKDRVIQRARELDLPVSLLIRKVLEDAFGAEPNASASTAPAQVAPVETLTDGEGFPSVLAWESVQLNQPYDCRRCGAEMRKGDSGLLGFLAEDNGVVIVCDGCKGIVQGNV